MLTYLRALLCLSAAQSLTLLATPCAVQAQAAQEPPVVKPTPIVPSEPAPAPEPAAPPSAATTPPPAAAPSTQHASRLSPPPPPGAPRQHAANTRSDEPPVTSADRGSDEADDASKDPMSWFGLSVKLGVANINAGSIDNPIASNSQFAKVAQQYTREQLANQLNKGACLPLDEKCSTPSRTGFHLALTLHMGGDGFGWDVEPYVSTSSDAVATGAYTGPKFDIHITDPFYLGFGFGFRAAYVSLDGWQHGADLFGRIPVHATYYLTPDFALTLEGSFGAGISVFMGESVALVNPQTGEKIVSTPQLRFGAARSFDFTVGVRFF